MRRILPLILAAATVLAACGSSDSKSSATSTSTRPPGTAAERRIARAGLIHASDLPGFASVARGPSEANDLVTLARGLPACATFEQGNRREAVNGNSSGFQRATTTANSSVVVFATAADAAAELDLYRDPTIVGCLDAVYRKSLSKSSLASLSVSPIAVENVGDGQFGFLVTAQVNTAAGTPTTFYNQIAGIQVGRALSSINVVGSPADIAEVQTKVLPKMAERLKAAGA